MSEVQKRKILLIDYDSDTYQLIADALEEAGFEVIFVSDPEKAIVKSREIEPHLIMISLVLFGSNGLEVSRSIRSVERLKTVPIFLLISESDRFDRQYAAYLGIRDVLMKPLNVEEIVAKTRKMFGEPTYPSETEEIAPVLPLEEEDVMLLSEDSPGERNKVEIDTKGADGELFQTIKEKVSEPGEEEAYKKSYKNRLSVFVLLFAVLGIVFLLFSDRGREFFNRLKGTPDKQELAQEGTISGDEQKTGKPAPGVSTDESKKGFTLTKKSFTKKVAPRKPLSFSKTNSVYSVHVGAFMTEANAVSYANKLKRKGYDVYIKKVSRDDKQPLHRVLIGKFDSKKQALKQSAIIRQKEGIESFVYTY
jgi:CheY-like chemotaxis protein